MHKNHDYLLSNAHQSHFLPKKSYMTKYMNSIWRDKRSPFLSDEGQSTFEDSFAGDELPLREKNLLTEHQLKAVWQQEITKARMMKGKVTEDELLESAGQIERLAGLVQERYAVSHAEAEKQVAVFLRRRLS